MAENRVFTIDTAAGPLSAFEARPRANPGKGVAVLVPGYTGSKEDFAALLPLIAESGYHAVAYSQPGQWLSAGSDDPADYTVAACAVGLLDVVDHVRRDGAVHVLGHSFGGLVARAAVLGHPDRFRSYTALCSGPSGAALALAGELVPIVEQALARGGMEAAWEVSAPAVGTEEHLEFLRKRWFGTKEAHVLGVAMAVTTEPDRTEELTALGLPTLVARGESDQNWPAIAQQDMASRLGVPYEVIAGAGHLPNIEQPAATAALLTRFWATVDRQP